MTSLLFQNKGPEVVTDDMISMLLQFIKLPIIDEIIVK